jgi:hypothetical protein
MYKKAIGFLGLAVVAVGAFLATNTSSSSNATDLTHMVKLNTANAECVSSSTSNGKCLTLSQVCVGDPGNNQCDF